MEIVKYLISNYKIDLTQKSISKLKYFNAIYYYIFKYGSILELFYGILIHFFYQTCLSYACNSGNLELVKFLLNQDDVKIDPKDIFF